MKTTNELVKSFFDNYHTKCGDLHGVEFCGYVTYSDEIKIQFKYKGEIGFSYETFNMLDYITFIFNLLSK